MEGISREQFAESVAAAIGSVRHFYREVDRLVAALKEALLDGDPELKVVRGSAGKGSSSKQHGRVVLRDEFSLLFQPHVEDDDEFNTESGDDEDDSEEDEGADEEPKRKSRPAELDPEQPLLALRVSLSTAQPVQGFEPSLQYAVLGDWQVSGVKPSETFALKRYMLRRIPMALGKVTDPERRVETQARAAGRRKGKGDGRISFRILGGIQTVALYDLDEPQASDDLAVRMKGHWQAFAEGQVDG